MPDWMSATRIARNAGNADDRRAVLSRDEAVTRQYAAVLNQRLARDMFG